MFLHIGGDIMVPFSDLVGIFDIQVEESQITSGFVEHAKNLQNLQVVDSSDVKSVVVTRKKLYYSPISSATLKKRSHYLDAYLKHDM